MVCRMTSLPDAAHQGILLIHLWPGMLLEGLSAQFTPDLRLAVPNIQAGRKPHPKD
ncbi:hypothetical protein GCM10022631_04500 [Deinococcus rubellus]